METLFSESLIPKSVASTLPAGYSIRPLSPSDYDNGHISLLTVLTKAPDPGRQAYMQRFYFLKNIPDTYFTIVITDNSGKVVGCGTVFLERKFLRGLGVVGHIEDIAVDKNQQGKSLGKKIILALTEIAQARGAYKVILDCSKENIPFYEKCGYEHKEYEMILLINLPHLLSSKFIFPCTFTRTVIMNFFKARPKTPGDIAKTLKEYLVKLDNGLDNRKRNPDDIAKLLQQMKHVLNGDGDSHPQPEAIAQLAQEVYALDLLQLLIKKIGKLEFEARKEVTTVFNCLLRRQIGLRYPTVEYILTKPQVLFLTLQGYNDEDVSLNTGMILREMLRHEALVKLLLYDEDHFYSFPKYIETTTFGECLTRHKQLVAEYLETHYDRFFSDDPNQLSYNTLIHSNNYVTKRQSLKLLGEILLDRSNFNVMTRYISYENNLKVMMNLLRDKSRNIQFEAFHVFKVFVANPKKAPTIAAILRRNREKLIVFLKDFHNDKDDEVFTDEKLFLIHNINEL
ncbi:hypothetical protein E3Q24_00393 [Wallemia mellicola]|nr:hypothetical protein E3Q24_00393 [Wallemia mellicola]